MFLVSAFKLNPLSFSRYIVGYNFKPLIAQSGEIIIADITQLQKLSRLVKSYKTLDKFTILNF